MTAFLTLSQRNKILTPNVQRIMQTLAASGEARVVGGAVRDVILDRSVGDIDFATTVMPERVIELLDHQDIKSVPTGLTHGTVTAVIDRVGYEITTLRRDVETDGRHAQVDYTKEWHIDAARRDFTFNALYLDAEGTLYDFFDGVDDAQNGRVRFIGDAHARIREDVLRILRFFRFYASFGRGAPDTRAMTACRDLAELIPRLSAERMMREIIKLLSAPYPLSAWRAMEASGVTKYVLPEASDTMRLQALAETEATYNEPPDALRRLAALMSPDECMAATLATRLKFSKRDSEKLSALMKCSAVLRSQDIRPTLRHILYIYGADITRAALLINGKNVSESLVVLSAWENPIFPLKGEDIIKSGVPAGPNVGDILRTIEQWWIAGDFRATRAACLEFMRQMQ